MMDGQGFTESGAVTGGDCEQKQKQRKELV